MEGLRSKRQLLESLYGGQFTLSTPLIKPNSCVQLPHRRSTTAFLETNHFNPFTPESAHRRSGWTNSFVPLVKTTLSTNLCGRARSFKPFSETGQRKTPKKHVIFTRNSTENLVPLPTRTSLKIISWSSGLSHKLLPPEMKPSECPTKGKKWEKKSKRNAVKRKRKVKVEGEILPFAHARASKAETKAGLSLDLQKTFWTERVLFGYIMTSKWLDYLQTALICKIFRCQRVNYRKLYHIFVILP